MPKNISGSFEDSGYKWVELSPGGSGPGRRGLQVIGPGLDRNDWSFYFKPNPHDNPTYNKKQQKLYTTLAGEIQKKWPTQEKSKSQEDDVANYRKAIAEVMTSLFGFKFEWEGVEYTLVRR
jgi:hypothetical protein